VVVLSSKHVSISTLSLKVDGCAMAWLYNLLASLFAEGIREYIVKTLHETLSDNMADLLTALNHYARYALFSSQPHHLSPDPQSISQCPHPPQLYLTLVDFILSISTHC
jgi:hypothetical protein